MLGLIEGIICATKSIEEENKAFNLMCESLPKEDADRIKKARREKRKEELKHRQALEIANASRARNFWGD